MTVFAAASSKRSCQAPSNRSAAETGEPAQDGSADDKPIALSLRQIVFRFALSSVGIIVLSIAMTYITDEIADRLSLGAGLAGALFLGIATSLPEVTSTIALFRIRNYDIAVGNIIGSNVFNFFVLAVADLVSAGTGVYGFADGKVQGLLMFGSLAMPLLALMLMSSRPMFRFACAAAAAACYIGFLLG